jgi:hypothetical protein
MNWYAFYKHSALDPKWWQNFYDHLSKTIPFVFNIDNAQTRFNTSGNDGMHKIWYSFSVITPTNNYSCNINFELAGAQYGGKDFIWKNHQGQVTWQNSTLQQISPQSNVDLVKIDWFVLKNMQLGVKNSELVENGFILPQNATPVSILTQIKNAIMQDMSGDGDNGDDGPDPSPVIDSPSSGVLQNT